MNTKKKRVFSMAVCILFIFVTFASLFYIVKEENHHCTGEDCPICANIHQAEQTCLFEDSLRALLFGVRPKTLSL